MSVRIITAELGSTFDLSSGVFHTLVSENMRQSSAGQSSMLYRPSSGIGVALGVKLGAWLGVGLGVSLGGGGRRSGPLHRRSAM